MEIIGAKCSVQGRLIVIPDETAKEEEEEEDVVVIKVPTTPYWLRKQA